MSPEPEENPVKQEPSNASSGNAVPYHETTSTDNAQEAGSQQLCPPYLQRRGYSIGEKIGGGAYSSVYKATLLRPEDNVLETNLAVKVINLEKVDAGWKDNCLKKEMKIIKKMNHPNIVKVRDIIKTGRSAFIFMVLISSDLSRLLAQKHLTEREAKAIFAQLCSALVYIHGKGVAHRDLKTENILLDEDNNVKLADFGFACFTFNLQTRKEQKAHTSCGTKGYCAPEVCHPPYDPKAADMYSAGVILFETLTGDMPFDTSTNVTDETIRHKQLRGKWKFPSEPVLSSQAKKLVTDLMNPDPEVRPTSEKVLKRDWFVHSQRSS